MAANNAATARKRGPGRPFKPGESGNLSGRPKKDHEPRTKRMAEVNRAYEMLRGGGRG